jgi:integrase
MPVVTLTQTFLNTGLVVPEGKTRIEICDSACRGLVIPLAADSRSVPVYYLRYKRHGKTTYDRLGTIQELTLTQARKLATQKKVEHAPFAKALPVEATPTLEEMTLDRFWTDHYLPYAKLNKRSWLRDEITYKRITRMFGDTRLKDITRYAVQQFQNGLAEEKLSPASIDHHPKLLRRMLNLAVQWDMLEKNPLRGIQLLNVDNRVEHYLDDEQLKRLLAVLHADSNRMVCLLLMFLLSTGARSNEARQATWSQIDQENGVWRIPATNSKSKKIRSVPLNDSALWVLEQVDTQGKHEVVFANPETGKAYTPVTHFWYRLRKKANIPNVRIHDLRHSFASMLVSGGRSLYEVQQILGHSDPKMTMRYSHLSSKTLLAAANVASVIVPNLGSVGKPGIVAKPLAEIIGKTEQPESSQVLTAEIVPFPKAA